MLDRTCADLSFLRNSSSELAGSYAVNPSHETYVAATDHVQCGRHGRHYDEDRSGHLFHVPVSNYCHGMFHDSRWSQKPEEEPTSGQTLRSYPRGRCAKAVGFSGGTVSFDVMNNEDCVPSDSFTGGQNAPNTGSDFEMSRVDEKTWKGYFYRDALQDEHCFGMGVCHWDATGVSADFAVLGEKFNQDDSATDAGVTGHPDPYVQITVTVQGATP